MATPFLERLRGDVAAEARGSRASHALHAIFTKRLTRGASTVYGKSGDLLVDAG
jgi:hypothetical protein